MYVLYAYLDEELLSRFFLFLPRNCFEKRQSQSESNWIILGKWHTDALLFLRVWCEKNLAKQKSL